MSSSTTVSGLATEPGPAHSEPAPSAPGDPSPAAEAQGIGSEGWATRLLRSAPLLLGIAYAAGALAWFPRWTVDDAYITFRYAENLARHGELNWNVGENPVEGYTGVLLPLTLAAGTWLGLPVGPTAKLIGIASLFLGGALLWALAGRVGLERASRSVVALGYFTCPILYTHALGGLETVLFLALGLAGLLALAAQIQEPGPSRAVGLPLALLLTSLARPEGVALTVFVFAAALFDAFRRSRAALTRLGVDVLLFYALPAACYFAWRWGYYGQALPNTYYAKWHRGLVPGSLRDLALFSALYLALPVLALTVLWVARRASRESEPCARVRTLRVVLAVGLAFTAVCWATYARSSLVMNYSHRFFAPFLPILLLAVGAMLERGLRGAGGSGAERLPPSARRAAAVFLGLQLGANVALYPREAAFAASTERLLADVHIPAGAFLREHVPAHEWIVVVVDAGAIPYVSGLKTVDFGGLNDEFLSRRFIDKIPSARIVDYFYARNPAALVFTSRSRDFVIGPEPVPVTDDPRFGRYGLAAVFSSPDWPHYHELVYLRLDLLQ